MVGKVRKGWRDSKMKVERLRRGSDIEGKREGKRGIQTRSTERKNMSSYSFPLVSTYCANRPPGVFSLQLMKSFKNNCSLVSLNGGISPEIILFMVGVSVIRPRLSR